MLKEWFGANRLFGKINVSGILIISALFPPEPVVSAMLSRDIAEKLSRHHTVVVLCPHPTRPEGFVFDKKFETENYKLHRLNSFTCTSSDLLGRFRESYSFGVHCAKYIQKNSKQIDCIYINAWPLFAQYKVIKIAKKLQIPCVLHIQDIYPESLTNKLPILVRKLFTKFLLPIDKFILNNANVILGISPNMISYLSKSRKIDFKKFELVRNWQNDDLFLNDLQHLSRAKKENFVFMYVGSLSQSAGVASLINSFHKAGLQNAKLVIAGNGSDKQNCIEIANSYVNDKIEFCEVGPGEVPELQSQADILLLPLKRGIAKTATPSKLTAYLLSAKPVIACVEDDTDVASIINEANCGFFVEPENVEILAETMQKVYKIKQSELENLGMNGRDYALTNLSKKTNLQKVVSVIENLVK
jgi:glycosyltransferase involved in cell wall biosynthesis